MTIAPLEVEFSSQPYGCHVTADKAVTDANSDDHCTELLYI